MNNFIHVLIFAGACFLTGAATLIWVLGLASRQRAKEGLLDAGDGDMHIASLLAGVILSVACYMFLSLLMP